MVLELSRCRLLLLASRAAEDEERLAWASRACSHKNHRWPPSREGPDPGAVCCRAPLEEEEVGPPLVLSFCCCSTQHWGGAARAGEWRGELTGAGGGGGKGEWGKRGRAGGQDKGKRGTRVAGGGAGVEKCVW